LELDLRPKTPFANGLKRFAKTKPLGALSLVVLIIVFATAVAAPLIAPYNPNVQNVPERLQSPSTTHWAGTDQFGRDIFSRIVYGSRVSLQVGFYAVAISTVAGTVIGASSGYVGGKFDLFAQRVVDGMTGFPFIVLAIIMVVALGASLLNVALALSIGLLPRFIRVARASTLSIKQEEYITAAVVIGASSSRIILRHVIPNALAPIFVLATGALGGVIIAEASLSFLGLGVPPPTPSWGAMLNVAARGYLEAAPWMAIFPGVALSVVVYAFALLGDALRDTLDPRLRGR
jgi:peptide/nickel transport system permease protein